MNIAKYRQKLCKSLELSCGKYIILCCPDHHTHMCLFTSHSRFSLCSNTKLHSSWKVYGAWLWGLVLCICATRTLTLDEGALGCNQSVFKFILGVALRAFWRQLEFFYSVFGKSCLSGACFVHRSIVVLEWLCLHLKQEETCLQDRLTFVFQEEAGLHPLFKAS